MITERTITRRGVRTAAILMLAGVAVDSMFWLVRAGVFLPLHLVTMLASIFTLVLLERRRAVESAWIPEALFLLINGLLLSALARTDLLTLQMGRDPLFLAQKMGVLTVALLAPSRLWVGLVTIGAFTALPIVENWTFTHVLGGQPSFDEPLATWAFGGFAVGLLIHLRGRRALEVRVERERARLEVSRQTMLRFLAIRDLANSPIQTLELAASLLRRGEIDSESAVRAMERAIARLMTLSELLRRNEPVDQGDARLDSVAILSDEDEPGGSPGPTSGPSPEPSWNG